MRFGISTHLYHGERLQREHLDEIASFGFETVELFATRSHFDYHDLRACEQLADWVKASGLELHSIHAPIVKSLIDGQWGAPYSNAMADEAVRQLAVRETDAALNIARRIPTRFVVVHLGTPDAQQPPPDDNDAGAARRSFEEIQRLAAPLGVMTALEVIPNDISRASALVRLLEDDLDLPDTGICMDFGHAFLHGDVVDAIEVCSGHVVTTHVHDNDGKVDSHLTPFDGAIDWPSALMAMRKVGYEGVFMFELPTYDYTPPGAVLERARRVRRRFEQILSA